MQKLLNIFHTLIGFRTIRFYDFTRLSTDHTLWKGISSECGVFVYSNVHRERKYCYIPSKALVSYDIFLSVCQLKVTNKTHKLMASVPDSTLVLYPWVFFVRIVYNLWITCREHVKMFSQLASFDYPDMIDTILISPTYNVDFFFIS
jgi:hypothetical protein